jgi:phosphoribosylaminoimidazolecarboxamide formyltransferase/IMP cyclohydrolase
VARPGCSYDDAVENIDIGGPAMVRAAAKNHAWVTVVVDPGDYRALLDELAANLGATAPAMRQRLAAKAFAHTAQYDAMVSAYFTGTQSGAAPKFPDDLNLSFRISKPPSIAIRAPSAPRSPRPGKFRAGNSPTTTSRTATRRSSA